MWREIIGTVKKSGTSVRLKTLMELEYLLVLFFISQVVPCHQGGIVLGVWLVIG